jgi:hypothetical protein
MNLRIFFMKRYYNKVSCPFGYSDDTDPLPGMLTP